MNCYYYYYTFSFVIITIIYNILLLYSFFFIVTLVLQNKDFVFSEIRSTKQCYNKISNHIVCKHQYYSINIDYYYYSKKKKIEL